MLLPSKCFSHHTATVSRNLLLMNATFHDMDDLYSSQNQWNVNYRPEMCSSYGELPEHKSTTTVCQYVSHVKILSKLVWLRADKSKTSNIKSSSSCRQCIVDNTTCPSAWLWVRRMQSETIQLDTDTNNSFTTLHNVHQFIMLPSIVSHLNPMSKVYHIVCFQSAVVTIWLELCTSYSSSCQHYLHHSCSNKLESGDILALAYPGCPGKWP